MHFNEIISNPGILKAIEEMGHTDATPIQEMTIPEAINGKDLLASAQTGTGKTAAFLIPALVRMNEPSPVAGKGPRVLILVPTRELALQVKAEAIKYSKHLSKVKTVCVFGGVPYAVQFKELSRHYEILVATPGRLMDHVEKGKIDFSKIEMLVLDEADRMLDMGFISAVEAIAEILPSNRQTLFFSATFKKNVVSLAKKLLNNPIEIQASHPHEKHQNIEQKILKANSLEHKYTLLDGLLSDPNLGQVIIFTSTKRQADTLSERLSDAGQEVGVLHGDIKQRQRTKTVSKLKDGHIKVLVATDVAARGIDIPTISHVINFDLPPFAEDYVHRIGRTGRAGAKGVAFSFVSKREVHLIKEIEKFTGQKLQADGEFEFSETKARKPQSFGDRKPQSFGDRKPQSFGDRKPQSFGDRKPQSFGDRKPQSFGDRKPQSFGDRKPQSFGDRKPQSFGDRKPQSFGDRKPQRDFSNKPQEGFFKKSSDGYAKNSQEGFFKKSRSQDGFSKKSSDGYGKNSQDGFFKKNRSSRPSNKY